MAESGSKVNSRAEALIMGAQYPELDLQYCKKVAMSELVDIRISFIPHRSRLHLSRTVSETKHRRFVWTRPSFLTVSGRVSEASYHLRGL